LFYNDVKPVCLKTSNNIHQKLINSKVVTRSVHIAPGFGGGHCTSEAIT